MIVFYRDLSLPHEPFRLGSFAGCLGGFVGVVLPSLGVPVVAFPRLHGLFEALAGGGMFSCLEKVFLLLLDLSLWHQ